MSGTPTVAGRCSGDVGDTHRGDGDVGDTHRGRGARAGTPTVDDVGDTHRGDGGRCWGHPPRRSAHRQRLPGRTVRDRQHRHPRRTDRGHDHGPGTTAAPPMPNRRRWPSKCRSAIPRRRLGLLLQWRRASHRRQRGRGPRWTMSGTPTVAGRCRLWTMLGTPTVAGRCGGMLDDVGDTHRGDGDVGDTHRVEARIANDCLAELSVTGNTVTLAGLIAGTTTVRGRQRRRPCRIGGGGLRSAGQPSRGADWASYFSGAAPAIDGSAGAGLDGQHIYLWRDEDIALVVLTQYSHFANGLRLEFRQLAECMRRTQLPVRTRPVANCRVAASSSCSSGWLNCVDRRRGWDAARPGEA